MKTTIRQQIAAVNLAKNLDVAKPLKERLNDAASTLAAVNFIGAEKILIAPELISEVTALVRTWNRGGLITPHKENLEKIILRLKDPIETALKMVRP